MCVGIPMLYCYEIKECLRYLYICSLISSLIRALNAQIINQAILVDIKYRWKKHCLFIIGRL